MANESVATRTEPPGIRELLISGDEAKIKADMAGSAAEDVGHTLTFGIRAIGDLMCHAAYNTDSGPIAPAVIADLGLLLRTIGELQQGVTEIGYAVDCAMLESVRRERSTQ